VDCCSTDVIEARFDDHYVQKKLAKYRKKGPKKTTSILARVITEHLKEGMTLLDIGGGIGDLQHLLLSQGISNSINCEASRAFIEACTEEATAHGYADRITHIHGDFAVVSKKVPKADIVTLDRVICCYPNMPELVQGWILVWHRHPIGWSACQVGHLALLQLALLAPEESLPSLRSSC
jgi:2-polyprenyl-3-methyl-5-hydroxy-6-metoxy-1,4-benzoquinol methylase